MAEPQGFIYDPDPTQPLSTEVVTAVARAHEEAVIDQIWRLGDESTQTHSTVSSKIINSTQRSSSRRIRRRLLLSRTKAGPLSSRLNHTDENVSFRVVDARLTAPSATVVQPTPVGLDSTISTSQRRDAPIVPRQSGVREGSVLCCSGAEHSWSLF